MSIVEGLSEQRLMNGDGDVLGMDQVRALKRLQALRSAEAQAVAASERRSGKRGMAARGSLPAPQPRR